MSAGDDHHIKQMEDFIIRTTRLVLRPPDESDVDELWPHVTDKRITVFLAWDTHTDKTTTMALIKSLRDAQVNGKGYHWLIVVDSKIAGLISLIDVRRQHRAWRYDRAELSYWLGPEFQGKGYATEAGNAVLSFAFDKLCLHKVVLGHAGDNYTSKKVAIRLGFKEYGRERDAFQKEGVWHQLIWYDLLAFDFLGAKKNGLAITQPNQNMQNRVELSEGDRNES